VRYEARETEEFNIKISKNLIKNLNKKMEIKGKKVFILYLTDWQRRMVKDFLGVDCNHWEVPIDGNSNLKYGIRTPTNPLVKKMYLTDWQIRELKDEVGVSCDFVELEKGIRLLYGVPPVVYPIVGIDELPKNIKIELTVDQRKIVGEILSIECHQLEIPLDKIQHVMYRVAPDKNVTGKILELTELQKRQIKKVFGMSCDFVELTKGGPITPYGVPPND